MLAGDGARSHIVQSGVTVDFLAAGGGENHAEFGVLQRCRATNLYAAQCVDHLLEAGEVDRHEPVDRQAGDLLDHLHQAFGAAQCVRRVQFGLGVPLVVAPLAGVLVVDGSIPSGRRVPRLAHHRRDGEVPGKRNGHHSLAIGGDVHQHDGVRARTLHDGGVSGAHLRVGAETAIGADDQEVLITVLSVGIADVAGVRIQCGDRVQ